MMSLSAKAEQLCDKGQFARAEKLFAKVLKEEPTHPGKMFNLAKSLHLQGKIKEAVDIYCDVMVSPGDYPAYKANAANNVGLILAKADKTEEAIKTLRFALALVPNFAPAHNNLANVLRYQGKTEEALAQYMAAIENDGSCYDARMNCGTIHLLTGDWERGWEGYEHRFNSSGWQTRNMTDPRKWNGEPLHGKTLLLTGEQGVGDAIMGIRYHKLIRAQYMPKAIHYHGHAETVDLFRDCLEPKLDRVTCEADPNTINPKSYDYHCPLLSLPRIFKTRVNNVPDGPYIYAGERAENDSRDLRIGLVWAGAPGHARDRFRSIDPAMLAPLRRLPRAVFYSLQFGEPDNRRPDWVIPMSSFLINYTDTARAMLGLDLLVSVDSSPVHLAGAMGVPVWMLTPANPDWRWMLTRTDTPWYPSVRLFRQDKEGDWSDVINNIKTELEALIDNP